MADSSFLGLFLLCAFAEDEMQLVVVGDQSSGKSSVLQAITKLPFPVDDKMCTRFATEVALQRSAGPEYISVQIKAAPAEEDSGVEDNDDLSAAGGAETIDDIECTTFPFGSQEFANEFKRVLAAVCCESRRVHFCSDMAICLGELSTLRVRRRGSRLKQSYPHYHSKGSR